jgi:hypothetical protein
MNKLLAELQRLYWLERQHGCNRDGEALRRAEGVLTPEVLAGRWSEQQDVALELVGEDERVRTLVVEFASRDWAHAEKLYLAVQNELDLPAPALSVSGAGRYGLWFSLAAAIPLAAAQDFLQALGRKYLADVPAPDLRLWPASGRSVIDLPPALNTASGKWSAFIDPELGSMFIDEAWLEMAPVMSRQADILAGFASVKPAELHKAMGILCTLEEAAAAHPCAEVPVRLQARGQYEDPKSFLLAVMNDPSAKLRQRIAAARALRPYFCKAE